MQNSMKHLDSVTSFHQKILSAWSSSFYPFLFIVFSRMLRNSTPHFVHPSVDQSDPFLVADTQLYKRLCLSVCWLVGLSVTIESKSEKTRISAPAHPSATDGRVSGLVFSLVECYKLYTSLSLCCQVGWSVRHARVEKWENAHFRPCPPVRNWWPCIRPCLIVINRNVLSMIE